MLVTVLQQDFGVHYSKDRVREVDFTNAKDLFIHGMIDDANGGTCVSMPVLYAAVGRRLGYSVRLVLAKGHVFCRWDAPDDRVNIEATNQGVNSFDDAYYKTWPQAMTAAEAASGRYLRSLTAAEELAVFVATRGHCLQDTGRLPEARLAYAQAHRIDPKAPEYLGFLAEAMRMGPGRLAESRQRPPRDPLEELRRVEAINAANRRLLEPPMPRGAPPVPVPAGWAQPGQPPVRLGQVPPQPTTPGYPAPPQVPPP